MIDSSITIIIPAYNVDKYLSKTLESIINQVEMPDEVILIDDGSSDNTLTIARSYNLPIPYKIISIKNGGQGNARNLGASIAKSSYVYFFDSDDIIDELFIKKIKSEINKQKMPDIILFSGESFNDQEYQGERWVDYSREFSGYFNNREFFLNKASHNHALFCSPCLYVSKKSFWDDNGLQFDSNYFEDEAIFFPLLFSCKNYCVINDILFYRRNRLNSTMTMQLTDKHVAGALNCIETTLALYYSRNHSKVEMRHIKKRLGNQIISYIKILKKTKRKISYGYLINTLLVTRSFNASFKSLLCLMGIHENKILKKLRKIFHKNKTNNSI